MHFLKGSVKDLSDCVTMEIVVAKQSTLIVTCLWACVKPALPPVFIRLSPKLEALIKIINLTLQTRIPGLS